MILVDSSVWIDYFRGAVAPHTDLLDRLLGAEPLAIGDLILFEVLQGLDKKREVQLAREMLTSLEMINICGIDIALKAADNFRKLRTLGVTSRKMIDVLIATLCIESRLDLLHNDRDFDPFVLHFGLSVVV